MNKNKIIDQFYEDFKVFMKENNMPLINAIEKSDNSYSFAYVEKDSIHNQCVPVVYEESLFDYNEDFIKSIFFHEFTHIYDANIRFKNLNNDDFNTIMDTYSEYHASQIEMGVSLHIKNKNDIVTLSSKLKSKTGIFYRNNFEDIESYILIPLADIITVLCQQKGSCIDMSNNEFAKQFVKMKKNIFYYYGKYDLYTKYSRKNMPDLLNKNCPNFIDRISEIHNAVKSKNIESNINNIRHLTKTFQDEVFEYLLKK